MLLSILLPLILPQAGIADVIDSRPPVTWSHERYGTENGVLCPGYLPGCRWDLARLKNGAPSGISEAVGDVLLAFLSRWEEKLFRSFYKDPYVQYLPHLSRGGNVSGISVCLYRGVVQAPQSGTFHFVGCGGDVMSVRFDEREVLQSFGSETTGQAVTVEQGKLYLLEWLVAEWTPKNAGGGSLHGMVYPRRKSGALPVQNVGCVCAGSSGSSRVEAFSLHPRIPVTQLK